MVLGTSFCYRHFFYTSHWVSKCHDCLQVLKGEILKCGIVLTSSKMQDNVVFVNQTTESSGSLVKFTFLILEKQMLMHRHFGVTTVHCTVMLVFCHYFTALPDCTVS